MATFSLTFDLSGMGGPTRSKSFCKHSSWAHWGTQASPPLEGSSAWWGIIIIIIIIIDIIIISSLCITYF